MTHCDRLGEDLWSLKDGEGGKEEKLQAEKKRARPDRVGLKRIRWWNCTGLFERPSFIQKVQFLSFIIIISVCVLI